MARPGLTRHRKFARLARLLGSEVLARGHLELLWDVAYENGDEILGDAGDVEFLAKWTGEAGKLAEALRESGFLELAPDGTFTVHDLWDHAPDYVRKRRTREEERRTKGASLRGEVEHPSDNDRAVTGQNPPNGRTRAPAPAPAPAPAQEACGGADAPPAAPAPGKKAKAADLVEAMRQRWNALAPPLCPRWEQTPKERRRAAEALLKPHLEDLQPLAWWDQALLAIARSPLLRGEKKGGGWRASPDWALKAENLAKIAEGTYDDVPRIVRRPPPTPAPPEEPPEPIPEDLEPVPRELAQEAFQEVAHGDANATEMLGRVQVAGRRGDQLFLVAPDKFVRDFVQDYWGNALTQAFAQRGAEGGIKWLCAPRAAPAPAAGVS